MKILAVDMNCKYHLVTYWNHKLFQRGELALTLLTHYKDDQDRLARIMDKLLDKEVHQMYKAPSLPTYYVNNVPNQVNRTNDKIILALYQAR